MSWIRCDTRLEQCLHFVTFVVQLFYSFGLGFEACGVQVLDMHTCFSGERSSERERERENAIVTQRHVGACTVVLLSVRLSTFLSCFMMHRDGGVGASGSRKACEPRVGPWSFWNPSVVTYFVRF